MGKTKKNGLSEKQLALVLIFPALLAIAAVAFYPVVKTFWLSMFDLQLNNPNKSTLNLSNKLNVELYSKNNEYMEDALVEISNKTKNEKIKTVINKELEDYKYIENYLFEKTDIGTKIKEVEKLLYDYKTVPENLKYVGIDERDMKSALFKTGKMRENLMKYKSETGISTEVVTAIQLLDELEDTMIAPNFVGFNNYKGYFKEVRMYKAIWNTMVFTFSSVAVELLLGLIIALIINKPFKGRGLFRAAVLIPWAIPTAISAMMWKFMYDGQTGILAALFAKLHIIKDSGALLTTSGGAMFGVVFSDVWKTTPYMALLLFAGLQQISISLYEAADVDGASPWQQFQYITLPLLKPAILVALLFRTLDAFRVFDLVYILTGGGPANGTETISIYAYKTMFSQMQFGKGSALSFIVFVCIAGISILYMKILGADVMKD